MTDFTVMEQIDLLQHVFEGDRVLLTELQNHKSLDPHRLLKRLMAVQKRNIAVKFECYSSDQILSFLEVLVQLFVKVGNSIKLSRAVEKLWEPYYPQYSMHIEGFLEAHILQILTCDCSDNQFIATVSVLLEQYKMVEQIFRKNLHGVMSWLAALLSLLIESNPLNHTTVQSQCLYTLVKVCLQLWQVCPSELAAVLWVSHSNETNFRQSVLTVVNCVVNVLRIVGFQTDCKLLSGTATAMILNTAPEPVVAVRAFDVLLYHTLHLGDCLEINNLLTQKLHTDKLESCNIKLSRLTSENLGPLALIRGTVACVKPEILWMNNKKHESDLRTEKCLDIRLSLVQRLFEYTKILCQGSLTLHYHAFEILILWYKNWTKLYSCLEISMEKCSIEIDSTKTAFASILEQTVELVILYWESPIKDVPESVVDVFSLAMSVWMDVKEKMLDFPNRILKLLLDTPWYVKGKYRILAILLNYFDSCKILTENPEIQSQLLNCLTTNHLASSATNVYKSFVEKIHSSGNEVASTEAWMSLWLPTVVKGLVSNDSVLRYNVSLHWIPLTIKLLPKSSSLLQDLLLSMMKNPNSSISRTRLLNAWVVVAKAVRAIVGTADLTDIHVQEALYCADEDVRSDSFALVCNTLKKAECISQTEVDLLKEHLPYNMKVDSAPFRQQLGSNLQKLLVRLRDSCVTLLKNTKENKRKLDCAVDFVEWLHELCIECLLPGACYQRRKCSLDILQVIYESLIYSPDEKQRKGFVPETATKLVEYAHTTGHWNFFSIDCVHALILCLLDGADEIKMSAFHLLRRCHQLPVEDNSNAVNGLCCHLLAEALKLCNSPKGHEGQSGSFLCKLLFEKYAIEKQITFGFRSDEHRKEFHISLYKTDDDSVLRFLKILLEDISSCWEEANKDLVRASKEYPLYGMIAALTSCLTDCDQLWSTPTKHLQVVNICGQFVQLCQTIIEKMLSVMAGVAGQDSCPSFAEISVALENLLLENQSDYNESTSLSPEYQYMLSFCWNNIKECCTALGEVAWKCVISVCPLLVSQIESIRKMFMLVLTKCRHKGVIEGCRSAFIRFCCAMFMSTDDNIQAIPATIVTELLTNLKKNALSVSATRRSAGLPIIIQSILTSEWKTKKTTSLTHTIKALFEISEMAIDEDLGITDLPQVHGLNIINSLFSDASLTVNLIGHVGHALILVIQQLGSAYWAVRNAGTRLFSTLVTRVFGQNKSHDNMVCNSVTFLELSSFYPELPPFMLKILTEAANGDICNISQIHPGLFPVLTLLSFLKPMETKDTAVIRQLKQFSDNVIVFSKSPVYHLRHLTAAAIVGTITVAEMMSSAMKCLRTQVVGMEGFEAVMDFNGIHGGLLFVNKLLDFIYSCKDQETLWRLLMEKAWLLFSNCGILSAEYVKILHKFIVQNKTLEVDEQIEISILWCCCNVIDQAISNGILFEEAVHFLFTVYCQKKQHLSSLIEKLLASPNLETRKSCLEHLQEICEQPSGIQINDDEIMSILCHHLRREKHVLNIASVLNLIATLYQYNTNLRRDNDDLRHISDWLQKGDDIGHLIEWFQENNLLLQMYASVNAAALPVLCIVMLHLKDKSPQSLRDHQSFIERCCQTIKANSHATNETLKMSSAKAINIIGEIMGSDLINDKLFEPFIVNLLSACMTLIQDEDMDIRAEACRFISCQRWPQKQIHFRSLHSNVCHKAFLTYICDNFWWSEQCIQYVSQLLYIPGELATILHEKSICRYQQLFDQEDNSFFAERLYNALDLYKCLKKMVKTCGRNDKTDAVKHLVDIADDVEKDLKIFLEDSKFIENGALLTIYSDNTVLASLVSLVVLCDIVNIVTHQYVSITMEKTEHTFNVHEAIASVIESNIISPALKHKLYALMEEHNIPGTTL